MTKINDETIEQKVSRLENAYRLDQHQSTDDASSRFPFYVVCKMVELAIAEEREACGKACDHLYEVHNYTMRDEKNTELKRGILIGMNLCARQFTDTPAASKRRGEIMINFRLGRVIHDEEREASGWKPIRTAPKDGTFVDLWLRGHRVPDCYCHKGDWMFLGDEGYQSFESRGMHNDPSHWMLSPNGPKDEVKS